MSNEALRLAAYLDSIFISEDVPAVKARKIATLLRQQAERIAELEGKIANLYTTMFAAAVEIQSHWEAHCDAEGYGPANLMHRLERGIASQYGYDAKTLQRIEAERDQLRAEVERLRVDAERYVWLRDNHESEWAICEWQDDPDGLGYYRDARAPEFVDAAIDHARTTHKDEG